MIKIRQKEVSFHDLKRMVEEIDWVPIAEILKRNKGGRGRKATFKPINCFRAFILGAYLEIEDDTELARRISHHKEYQEFCGVSKEPSHDVLYGVMTNACQELFAHLPEEIYRKIGFIIDTHTFDEVSGYEKERGLESLCEKYGFRRVDLIQVCNHLFQKGKSPKDDPSFFGGLRTINLLVKS